MNPPGIYDQDPSGFYFIPTYNPRAGFLYPRAIEDRGRFWGTKESRTFLQLSIANHLADEIRRQHSDGVFVEGWALYGEEMLMRRGSTPDQSAGQGQVLRLSGTGGALGVDVNLHTGRWSFEQAVKYFMERGDWTARPPRERRRARRPAVAEDHVHGGEVADHAALAAIGTSRAPTFGSAPFTIGC